MMQRSGGSGGSIESDIAAHRIDTGLTEAPHSRGKRSGGTGTAPSQTAVTKDFLGQLEASN